MKPLQSRLLISSLLLVIAMAAPSIVGSHIIKHTTQHSDQAPTPTQVSIADLAKLRWIEGTWRGTGDVQKPFYERYHFENESTLVVEGLTDENTNKVNEVTRFEFKDGQFCGGNEGSRWCAGDIGADTITFE